MKKRFAICSTIVLLLLLSACGAPQALDFSYAPEGEELSSLMVETSQTHRAELEHVPSAADFADAISDDPASAGLLRELMKGIAYIEKPENLAAMNKELPVFFIAGGDDPVGNYGKGVRKAAEAFQKAGMTNVTTRIYPLCRHEILNEINKEEIYEDVAQWITKSVES